MICFGDGGFEKLTVQEVLPIEERETNKFPELNIDWYQNQTHYKKLTDSEEHGLQ